MALGSDSEIHRMFGGSRDRLRPITADAAVRWARGLVEHPCAWVIERQALIGEIRLDRLEAADRRASLAIGIHDAGSLGKGYGTEAVGLVLGYVFGALGLHRVSLRVLAYNRRAIRCYEKCGFLAEGRDREAGLVDDAGTTTSPWEFWTASTGRRRGDEAVGRRRINGFSEDPCVLRVAAPRCRRKKRLDDSTFRRRNVA